MGRRRSSNWAQPADVKTEEPKSMIPVEKETSTQNKKRNNKLTKAELAKSGCVFVTGLPFGMTERNLRRFMKQFGEVINCRVHTCPKTGRNRGYGYVHFRVAEVARIAAQTMNNYFITGSVVKCRFITGDHIKDEFFSLGDRGYHSRIKKGVQRLNKTKRSDDKEEKMLKKRQLSALKHLSKLQDSELTGADFGVPERYTGPKPVVKKEEGESSEGTSQAKQKPKSLLPRKTVKKSRLPRKTVKQSLLPKNLVLTRKGRANYGKIRTKLPK